MTDTYDLDRAQRVAENIDALGKKWVVKVNRSNGLSHARPEPDRENAVIPKNLQGQWTKPSLLQSQIEKYVNQSWDMAEAAVEKARKKKEVQDAKSITEAEEGRDAEADNSERASGRAAHAGSESSGEEESKEEKEEEGKEEEVSE